MKNRNKKEFTLIELLVVIAIIAILASILLPALRTAKEKGKSISCLGNERQQALAWNLYLSDNSGWFPHYWPYEGPPYPNIYWFTLFDSYDSDGKIWKCPSHDYPNWIKDVGTLSYGYNAGGFVASGTTQYGPTVNIANLKETSRDILMCDSLKIGSWSCIVTPPDISNNYLNPRHINGMNLLWADGHASYTKYPDLLRENMGTYNNPPPGWYGPRPWFRDPAYPEKY
jgi:prepilin-type N-terminal cleavage/methylation domain-containing protein/prepilin-type processing-associated H-X9-DG protein